MADVTEVARTKYANKQKVFHATNQEWGTDGWPGYVKSLVIVYDICGNYATAVAREKVDSKVLEGTYITLPWYIYKVIF